MKFRLITLALVAVSCCLADEAKNLATVADALQTIYHRCTDAESMISCAKPKVLAYLSEAVNRDDLPITRDLSIVRSRSSDNEAVDDNFEDVYSSQDLADPERKQALRDLMLERLDAYLSSHRLVARLPEDIASSNIVPRSFMDSVPRQLSVPLTEEENGRGFVKKVMIPFLLGLKFKATALVPLALALIALKTWKALTLGLLSLVLSGAMLIFKLTKPKVAYEVLHYGHPPIEHHPPAPHWDVPAHVHLRAYRD